MITIPKFTLGQKAISTIAYMLLMFPRIDDYPEELAREVEMFLDSLSEAEGIYDDDVAAFYSEVQNEIEEGYYLEKKEYEHDLEEALDEVFACPENIKEKIMEIARDVRSRW